MREGLRYRRLTWFCGCTHCQEWSELPPPRNCLYGNISGVVTLAMSAALYLRAIVCYWNFYAGMMAGVLLISCIIVVLTGSLSELGLFATDVLGVACLKIGTRWAEWKRNRPLYNSWRQ